MKSISYSYHEIYKEQLLVKTYLGEISFEDVTKSWNKAIEEGIVKSYTKGVLNDYRNALLKISVDDVERLMDYFTQKGIFKNFRFALLMEKPDQIVFPTFAGTLKTEFLTAPFTTEEAAISWILNSGR